MALCSYDEAYTIPTEKAARITLRTMQIVIEETGICDTVDPLAGSYYVESLTNNLIEEARKAYGAGIPDDPPPFEEGNPEWPTWIDWYGKVHGGITSRAGLRAQRMAEIAALRSTLDSGGAAGDKAADLSLAHVCVHVRV